MQKKIPIIVKKCNIDGFLLYPDESGYGINFSKCDQLELFEYGVNIYPDLIYEISKKLQDRFDISPTVIEPVVRNTIVPLLNVFISTTVRVGMAASTKHKDLSVITMDSINSPKSIEEFSSKAKDDANFNQYLVYFLRTIWGFEETSCDIHYEKDGTHQSSYTNYMSRLYPRKVSYALLNIVRRFFFKIKSKFFIQKNFITKMSYLKIPFTHKGMFVRNFQDMNVSFQISDSKINHTMREDIFNYNLVNNLDLDGIFKKIALTNEEKIKYKKKLYKFLKRFYPLHSLEMMPEFVNLIKPQIGKYKPSILVTGAGLDTKNIYLSALLKDRGFKLLRLQHGGYTGYYEFGHRQNYMWTNEFNMCDYYLTWGWDTQRNKMDMQKTRFIPFVSPWMSERKKYWGHYDFGLKIDHEFDVLIAPGRLMNFHNDSWLSPVDDVYDNSNALVSVVRHLKDADMSILYKPPSIVSIGMYSNSIKEMIEVGGDSFKILKNIDKGLEIGLVERASLILWDVVGFGFQECMACGIPTMVFIKSLLPLDDNAKDIFYKLENVGILHLSVESLVREICIYKQNPQKWILDSERQNIINNFSNEYCNTDDNWDKELTKIIKKLEVGSL